MYVHGHEYIQNGIGNRPDKILRREKVVQELCRIPCSSPLLFTFPGAEWITEKQILQNRPKARFIGLEKDKKIWHKAVWSQPKGDHQIICHDFKDVIFTSEFDGAWVDFIGPITDQRIPNLLSLWQHTKHVMVITSRYGRWRGKFNEDVKLYGLTYMLRYHLGLSYRYSEDRYGAGSRAGSAPMHQMMLWKD